MFKVIHPNRWFIWTLVFLLSVSLVLMYLIQFYLAEIELQILEGESRSFPAWKTYESQAVGIAVRYPFSWQIEIIPEEPQTFTLQNPPDYGENLTFSKVDAKYEEIILGTLDSSSESRITIDGSPGVWLKSDSLNDPATTNVILIQRGNDLYYIAGQSSRFEIIVKNIKFR